MSSRGTNSYAKSLWRVGAFVLVVVALFGLAQLVDVDVYVELVREQLNDFGAWAPVVFVLAYAALTLLGAPGTPLTVLAALVFGPWLAFLVMTVATTLAASLGFGVARHLIGDHVDRLLARHEKLDELRKRTDQAPVLAVLGMRLMPAFPFTLVNYALGVSRLRYWKYIAASQLAMIPMNLVWIFSADAVYRTVIRGEPPWGILAVSTGLAISMFALLRLVRKRMAGGSDE